MIVSKNRIKLLSGIILFLVIPTYGCGYVSYFGPPTFFPVEIELPIDLSRAGATAKTDFKIFFDDNYMLYLTFVTPADSKFDKALLEFLNDGWSGPGTIIPVKLLITKLNDKEEEIILEKEYFTQGISGLGSTGISRPLTILHFEPGMYRIKIENEKDFKELSHIRVLLNSCYFRAK